MRTKTFIAVFVIFLCSEILLYGEFDVPQPVPADRLIENINAYLKEHPKDGEAYYNLARVHYIAFVNKSFEVAAFKRDPFLKVAPDWHAPDYYSSMLRNYSQKLVLQKYGFSSLAEVPQSELEKINKETNQAYLQLRQEGWKPDVISDEQVMNHPKEAITNFEKAIELEKNNALYYLGLASLYEQFIPYRDSLLKDSNSRPEIPEKLKQINYQKAVDTFLKAYQLSINKDLNIKQIPLEGLRSIISYEAGNGFIRTVKNLKTPTKQQKQTADEVAKTISKFRNLPPGPITPIIFSLEKTGTLSDLLLAKQKVQFDLDGSGRTQSWQWVKPSTAFLVWDPENSGKITSGRQMFGSVTWWIFFSNGYRALDTLDNNRDGKLSGNELEGLSAWFDKNSNGISENGEVITLEKLGVESISTSASQKSAVLMNTTGIKFKNGNVYSTFDWIASPIR